MDCCICGKPGARASCIRCDVAYMNKAIDEGQALAVERIVAWLRREADEVRESKYGRYRRAADAIERGDYKKDAG